MARGGVLPIHQNHYFTKKIRPLQTVINDGGGGNPQCFSYSVGVGDRLSKGGGDGA